MLEECEVVFCEDTRVSRKLLDLLSQKYGIDPKKKEFYSIHSHNEERVLSGIDPLIFQKKCVYMSDAGTPCISDPGALLALYAKENDIDYDVLPGASAATTAYAASGFLDSKFVFYGFLPHKTNARAEELKKLCAEESPVIFYEAPHRIEQFFKELCAADENAEVFAAKEMTKLYQRYFKGSPSSILASLQTLSQKGEWCVAVKFSSKKEPTITLSVEELMELEIPKKQLAKLIAKATGENPKTIYEKLITK